MKKIIFFLLVVSSNIFGASDSDIVRQEIGNIHNKFKVALASQDFDTIEDFIIKNIDFINKSGQYKETFLLIIDKPVYYISLGENKAFKTVKLLIQLGADIFVTNDKGETIFHTIPNFVIKAIEEIQKEKEELDKSLLDVTELPSEIIEIINNFHSAKQPKLKGHPILNSQDFHYLNTPLHVRSLWSIEDPKSLIEYKADLEIRNADLETPIFSAIRNTEILKLLIEARANINHRGHSNVAPLDRAKNLGAREAVRILGEAAIKKQNKNNQCCVIQ